MTLHCSCSVCFSNGIVDGMTPVCGLSARALSCAAGDVHVLVVVCVVGVNVGAHFALVALLRMSRNVRMSLCVGLLLTSISMSPLSWCTLNCIFCLDAFVYLHVAASSMVPSGEFHVHRLMMCMDLMFLMASLLCLMMSLASLGCAVCTIVPVGVTIVPVCTHATACLPPCIATIPVSGYTTMAPCGCVVAACMMCSSAVSLCGSCSVSSLSSCSVHWPCFVVGPRVFLVACGSLDDMRSPGSLMVVALQYMDVFVPGMCMCLSLAPRLCVSVVLNSCSVPGGGSCRGMGGSSMLYQPSVGMADADCAVLAFLRVALCRVWIMPAFAQIAGSSAPTSSGLLCVAFMAACRADVRTLGGVAPVAFMIATWSASVHPARTAASAEMGLVAAVSPAMAAALMMGPVVAAMRTASVVFARTMGAPGLGNNMRCSALVDCCMFLVSGFAWGQTVV